MPRFFKDRKSNKGMAPGSLVFIGNKKMDFPEVSLMSWNAETLEEIPLNSPEEIIPHLETSKMNWINVYGIHDSELIQKFGEILDIPSLLLEDIINTDQRPKFDDYETCQGFILKALEFHKGFSSVLNDQVSFVMGKNYVISFQEKKGTFFNPVRERIRNSKGRIRTAGPDYLIYALLDTMVDNYLDIIGQIGDNVETIGNSVIGNPTSDLANQIYKYKIEINVLRKNIRPVKEMIMLWLKTESLGVQKKTKPYITDLADLATQAEESIEIYNNLLADALNIHNSNLSNKANEIMKVLTIFAAIFIPLTFFAGIYGMNFEYLPELKLHYAYPVFWGIVVVVAVGMFVFFKRKKWL